MPLVRIPVHARQGFPHGPHHRNGDAVGAERHWDSRIEQRSERNAALSELIEPITIAGQVEETRDRGHHHAKGLHPFELLGCGAVHVLSLIHISEPTRLLSISYAVF